MAGKLRVAETVKGNAKGNPKATANKYRVEVNLARNEKCYLKAKVTFPRLEGTYIFGEILLTEINIFFFQGAILSAQFP